MFNKVQSKQQTQQTSLIAITEAMQSYDVRYPIPGSKNENGKILAIDCEMVQCENEIGANVQMLARITVLNYNGYVVLDQYYKPRFRVINYVTKISGITPQIIKDKPIYNEFEKAKLQLLFKDKTIVGHTLKSDFEAMELNIEEFDTKDLIKMSFLKLEEGSSLKKMCLKYLGQKIQSGQHSSEVDARASLFIFRKFRNQINLEYKQQGWQREKEQKVAKKSQKNKYKQPITKINNKIQKKK